MQEAAGALAKWRRSPDKAYVWVFLIINLRAGLWSCQENVPKDAAERQGGVI
jgi:hypothetical protein